MDREERELSIEGFREKFGGKEKKQTTIYCMHCGKELPSDAMFCLSCGSPVGGSTSPAASSSSNTELYRIEINNIFRFMDRYEDHNLAQELGGGVCIVKRDRLIFQTKKSGTVQVFLRDIVSVEAKTPNLIFSSSNVVRLKGFGWIWCKQNQELASQIQKAMLNI